MSGSGGPEANGVDVIGVHGMGQEQGGWNQIAAAWSLALADGLQRAAGHRVDKPNLDIAYYGDLFDEEPDGSGKGQAAEVEDLLAGRSPEQIAELIAAVGEDIELDDEPADKAEIVGLPRPIQRLLGAVDRRFGAAAGILRLRVFAQVQKYLTDSDIRAGVDARVDDAMSAGCPILIGHSLGSVVAYEFARRHPGTLKLLVTLGSPLGLRMVRERIKVEPLEVPTWANVFDPRDPVACASPIAAHWPQVFEREVDNGWYAHRAAHYLAKRVTGTAVLHASARLAP